MKSLKKRTKIIVIVAAVVVALLLVLLLFWRPILIKPALYTLLAALLVWLGFELFIRIRKKQRQKKFDEGIAAKEGIDDRKREWGGWVEELDQQGIDRYELPFYMIVGEPQSGKSVLLQNSDLHFPFGQDRLSGVGGTRGCDWWFTDEAVVLDIAGRLFTHEGGVADKLEWEAFLDLLFRFRPLCPANGVLLVLPCDSLLEDSPDVCQEKANKIQNALLTLTQKLQAQLPVYLVLTKGDKVFGFAESVHRLEAKNRHEMFGWSRGGDKPDAPFDLEEVRQGFRGLVERARLLRERMIATARIPEALPEIDRLYAFPDELGSMEGNLEIYLTRIFTESGLVDRTAFRGIYLTSGLQTGVPVAKVCRGLLGGDVGEGDKRPLEGLFSHQRAYFIKDLIKRRVFSERGLVRPTEGRVIRARRNAMLGYGASALIAGLALVYAVIHIAKPRGQVETQVLEAALESSKEVRDPTDPIPASMAALARVRDAIELEPSAYESAFQSTRPEFRRLYAEIFDERLAPALREKMKRELLAIAKEPKKRLTSHQEFLDFVKGVNLLLGEIDFSDGSMLSPNEAPTIVRKFAPASPEFYKPVSAGAAAETEEFSLAEAMSVRSRLADVEDPVLPAPPGVRSDPELEQLVKQAIRILDNDVLEPGSPLQPDGHLGYMVAWKGLNETHDALKTKGSFEQNDDILELCHRYVSTIDRLTKIHSTGLSEGPGGEVVVKLSAFSKQYFKLSGIRDSLKRHELGPDAELPAWEKGGAILRFACANCTGGDAGVAADIINSIVSAGGTLARNQMVAAQGAMGQANSFAAVHEQGVEMQIKDAAFINLCAASPTKDWNLRELSEDMPSLGTQFLRDSTANGALYYTVKCRAVALRLPEMLETWDDVRRALAPAGTAANLGPAKEGLDLDSVRRLAVLRNEFSRLARQQDVRESHAEVFNAAITTFEERLLEHVRAAQVLYRPPLQEGGEEFDIEKLEALATVAAVDSREVPELRGLCLQKGWAYLNGYEQALDDGWEVELHPSAELPTGDPNMTKGRLTEERLKDLREHIKQLDRPSIKAAFVSNSTHTRWLKTVDTRFANRIDWHAQKLREHWTPSFVDAFKTSSLSLVAKDVIAALDEDKLNELITDRTDANPPPYPADPVVTEDSFFVKNKERFPALAAALQNLQPVFLPPEPDQFVDSGSPGLRALSLAREMDSGQVRLRDGRELAELADEQGLSYLNVEERPPTTAAELYGKTLWDGLSSRLVQEVRTIYIREFEDLLKDRRRGIDALFARTVDDIQKLDDGVVLEQLGHVLDREKGLSVLRSEYFMIPDEEETLRPAPDQRQTKLNDLWVFEEFCADLQAFLIPESQVSVDEAEFKVILRIPDDIAGTIWQRQAQGGDWRKNLHYGIDSGAEAKKSECEVRADLELESIAWEFLPEGEEIFWLRWSEQPLYDPRDPDPNDRVFRVTGSLVPILLAWMGEPDAGRIWWEDIQFMPERSKTPARIDISFSSTSAAMLPIRPDLNPVSR